MKYFINKLLLLLFIISFCTCNKTVDENGLIYKTGASVQNDNAASLQPNIILIVGDDVGYEIPTYNGGESYSTPNLDFLAANGIQFSNFYSHPDGPPSRLAVITGKYNCRNWEKFGFLPPSSKTIANLLRDAGYATCFTGKWQYDGGDISIKSHGFDKYLAFQPFNPTDNNGHDQFYHRYKNPYLYENGNYLPDSVVKDKYSEDMMFDYASNFIDSNKQKPFLLWYAHTLIQRPYCPTPDDPGFAAWNPDVDDNILGNLQYFPGMVSYMDKIIGKLIAKVNTAGLTNRTVFIFISDNGTNTQITSIYKGMEVKGAKNSTTRNGINVPLVVYSPGIIAPGPVDTSLVDMTDMLPTIANMAHVIIPAGYKPLDGTTFYDNLQRNIISTKQRSGVYCYWSIDYHQDVSYVFDYNYKLYDSLNGGFFIDLRNDIYEQHPIPDSLLTPQELQRKLQFSKVLKSGIAIANN